MFTLRYRKSCDNYFRVTSRFLRESKKLGLSIPAPNKNKQSIRQELYSSSTIIWARVKCGSEETAMGIMLKNLRKISAFYPQMSVDNKSGFVYPQKLPQIISRSVCPSSDSSANERIIISSKSLLHQRIINWHQHLAITASCAKTLREYSCIEMGSKLSILRKSAFYYIIFYIYCIVTLIENIELIYKVCFEGELFKLFDCVLKSAASDDIIWSMI